MEHITQSLTFIAATGSGLLGGLFFVFSICIMPALARLPAEHGMATMKMINATIMNVLFLTLFMGTTLLGAILLVSWLFGWIPQDGLLVVGGSLSLIFGMFGATMVFNVPMNDALAAANPGDTQAVALWEDYLSRWTRWNHVRTVASILCSGLLTLSLWM